MWESWNPYTQLVVMKNSVFGHCGKWSDKPSNFKQLSYYPEISLLDIYPKEMKASPHKNLHMNVHSSIAHNSEK
jgi:hypothetical protein